MSKRAGLIGAVAFGLLVAMAATIPTKAQVELDVDQEQDFGLSTPPEAVDISELPPEALVNTGDLVIVERDQWIGDPNIGIGPEARPAGIEEIKRALANKILEACPTGPDCENLQQNLSNVRRAEELYPGCSSSAQAFVALISRNSGAVSESEKRRIRRDYDLNCLASLFERIGHLNLTVEGSSIPDKLRDANVLQTVGFLGDQEGIFCGALLRPNNQIVTAKHCVSEKRLAYAFGWVKLHRLDGSQKKYKVQLIGGTTMDRLDAIQEPVGVADDWIALEIVSDDELSVPKVAFAKPSPFSEAIVFGNFRTTAPRSVVTKVGLDDPRLGLRWPRNGSCFAIDTTSQCVRLMCQTVNGFSGSPVFNISSEDGEPLQVIGIISGAISYPRAKSECSTRSSLETAAVPTRDFD